MEDSVQKLLANGHRLPDIEHYNIDQFIVFLDAAERTEAMSRIGNTMDLLVVVGGLFGGKESLNKHFDSLQSIAKGE